ncbi:sensor histidine kinase [Streptomyces sp. H39-S7]|uniref:sensor histidine kinase n=1 Tax=Streptomyces sp. H39-S7 TaxID=3004357 RepID=UPI0022AF2E4C|nr:histidine kinase [Streptomyces sp. H39-S7]MCZ4121964.1 histidine kinase [Streptomyces sp. H39-S7]
MDTDERQGWRRQVRDALRPDGQAPRWSRRAVVTDAVLALALTVIVLIAVSRLHFDASWPVGPRTPFDPCPAIVEPLPPDWPLPPGAPPPGASFQPAVHAYVLAALTTLPLAARRRFPLAVFWVVMCATLAGPDYATRFTPLVCFVAACSALFHSRNLTSTTGSFALAAVLAATVDWNTDPELPFWSGRLFVLLVVALIASVIRYWQLRLKETQLRFTELQVAQERAMREAIDEERSRIARELHDVVTHNVSVMVIQAGAARKVMDTAPEQSKEALLAVEASGRAAMSELRHVMGLIAASGTGPSDSAEDALEPQPGLDQLHDLVERVHAAGLPVTVTLSPPPEPLPPGVDLTAYRVVQEALTNTMKHAAGSTASVTIGHDEGWLEIEVTDTGGAWGTYAQSGDGRGLIGLRERLAVYGGTLAAGHRIGGGYKIEARVPWRAL